MTSIKLLVLPAFLFLLIGDYLNRAAASPIPAKYDQRQEGETNVRADLSNIMIVVIPSDGVKLVDPESIGTLLQIYSTNRRNAINNKPAPHSSPYKVDIEQSAIDKLHADMDSINSIIPASKTFDDKDGENEMPSVKEENTGMNQETEGSDKEKVASEVSATDDKKPEVEATEQVVKIDEVSNGGTTMAATTMEAIITSVNSYSKNGGLDNGEKFVKLQPAAVTVLLSKKPESPSGDVPFVTSSTVLAGNKKDTPLVVDIQKQSSNAPSKDMPLSLSSTVENLKRPMQVPSEEVSGKVSPVKISPKVSNQDPKQQYRHHHHQHQQSTKPPQTKKPSTEAASSEVVDQSSPTTSTRNSSKSPKPEVNQQDHERKLKMLQTGLIHCMPGQKLDDNGECVISQIRQSRREDMERLLAALRFGVGPAYRAS